MQKKILFGMLLWFSCVTFATDIAQYINHQNCDQIVLKPIYQSCYDYALKGTKYVAYTVNGELLKHGQHIKQRPQFYSEYSIPVEYRSYPNDYTHSGYDRGHMANHADFNYAANIVYMTYSLANVVPQAPNVNRNTWIKAERYERTVALKFGSVNVINGVVYAATPPRIGKNKIAVPSGFWKMIYNDDKKFERCFKYANDNNINVKADKLSDHAVECKQL